MSTASMHPEAIVPISEPRPVSGPRTTSARAGSLLSLSLPVVLALLACWAAYSVHGNPSHGVDDAQILFSYSSNLATGRGLVYANNPEHVEGATSLLWTLLCAIPFRLGLDESGVLAIALLLLCATQVLAVTLIRRASEARQVLSWPFELLYLLAVFSSPAYSTWMSITLMDTCLWGFLVLFMTYVVLRPPRSGIGLALACVPFFLAPLSRPEAAFVVPCMIGMVWLSGDRGHGCRRLVAGMSAAFLLSLAGVTVFRLMYFGYPVPNTFYAKVSPSLSYNFSQGIAYMVRFVFNSGSVVLAASFFLLWCAGDLFGRCARLSRKPALMDFRGGLASWRLVSLFSIVLLVTPIPTGGDHFVGHRLYQPALPLMVLAAVLFLVARLPRRALAWSAPPVLLKHRAVVAVVFLGIAYWAHSDAYTPSWLETEVGSRKVIYFDFGISEGSMRDGRLLRALFSNLPVYPVVAVTAAGGFARTYPGRIVDLFGLNTPEIAHNHGSRRGTKNHAAFEKEPFFKLHGIDVLLATPPIPPKTVSFATVALKGLLDDPRFTGKWRYGRLYRADHEEIEFQAFYSSRLVNSLEQTGRYGFRETMKWSGEKWVVADGTDSVLDCHTDSAAVGEK